VRRKAGKHKLRTKASGASAGLCRIAGAAFSDLQTFRTFLFCDPRTNAFLLACYLACPQIRISIRFKPHSGRDAQARFSPWKTAATNARGT